jgi:FkbM family methyltransferase
MTETQNADTAAKANETLAHVYDILRTKASGLSAPNRLCSIGTQDTFSIQSAIDWLDDAEKLCVRLLYTTPHRSTTRRNLDASFLAMMMSIKNASLEQVMQHIKQAFYALDSNTRKRFQDYVTTYPLWGSFDPENGDHTVLENRARSLHDHADDFLWLYERLADYRSRYTLFALVNNWYSFVFNDLDRCRERIFREYFDLDVIQCDENEVLVDLGAFTGDTVIDYIAAYGLSYKRIYCYEITSDTFRILQENTRLMPNIVLCNRGVGDKPGVMYLSPNPHSSANRVASEGEVEIPIVTVDEDIKEPVTFIKMDIEGFEQNALLGCREHIQNERPKLAISIYHNNEDIWKIPRMIEEFCPGYLFYLRHHGGTLVPTEMTLLAVFPENIR